MQNLEFLSSKQDKEVPSRECALQEIHPQEKTPKIYENNTEKEFEKTKRSKYNQEAEVKTKEKGRMIEVIKEQESYQSNDSYSKGLKVSKKSDRKYFNRSSNNSHKKYSAAARKNLFKYLNESQKKQFNSYSATYKSSRIYFFCILISALIFLAEKDVRKFIRGFLKDIKQKILKYLNEISITPNQQLKKFRKQQIEDIKISILSFKQFYVAGIEAGIQCLYKKSKGLILKLPEYQRSVKIVRDLQQKYAPSKTFHFDIQDLIDLQINKKIRDYELDLGLIDSVNGLIKPSNLQIVSQGKKHEQKFEPQLKILSETDKMKIEKLKQDMNKKTTEEQSEEEEPNPHQNMVQFFRPPEMMMPFMFPSNAMPTSSFLPFGFSMSPMLPLNTMTGFQMMDEMKNNANQQQQDQMARFRSQFFQFENNLQ